MSILDAKCDYQFSAIFIDGKYYTLDKQKQVSLPKYQKHDSFKNLTSPEKAHIIETYFHFKTTLDQITNLIYAH